MSQITETTKRKIQTIFMIFIVHLTFTGFAT